MRLVLERLQLDQDVTIGSMAVDGNWLCWTCEDPVRPPGVKVAGRTAIPAGRYRVVLSLSPRLGIVTPEVLNVPAFTGIRIHIGNDAGDTEGCILVGLDRLAKSVGRSRKAFAEVMARLQAATTRGEEIWLLVTQ